MPADALVDIDPWKDRARLHAAVARVRSAFEELLPLLVRELDGLHKTDLGARYWRILLGPWLLYHLQQLEDRSARLELLRISGNPAPARLAREDFQIPRDTADYHDLFQTELYELQLHALIQAHLGEPGPETRARRVEPARTAAAGVLRQAARDLRAGAYAFARRAWPTEVLTDGVYPLGTLHETLTKHLDLAAWPVFEELPENLRVPARSGLERASLARLPSTSALAALAISTLPWTFPALFLEGFAAARVHARRCLGRPPRLMLHGPGIHYRDFYKLLAAEASREGTILAGFQHGGHYGFSLWSNAEWHERAVCDLFLTWGWSEDEKTVPVPVPWLGAAVPRVAGANDLLFVSASSLRLSHELFCGPMSGSWRAFFSWRGRFFDAIGADAQRKSRLRLFPKDYGWNEREDIRGRWPDLRLDDLSIPFRRSLETAALVVTDHPGTTFLESLAWDRPGVHFWDDGLWESRPAALRALEPLRRCGILHSTPESAAAKASAVLSDPESWWREPELVAARREFVRRYARSDAAWASEWARVLRSARRT